jgi:hypothetical protein
MGRRINPDDVQPGLYVRPAGWRSRTDAWGKLYEVEARDGTAITLRDVMVPTDECRGSNHSFAVSAIQVSRGYELIEPAADMDYLTEMLAA